MELRGVLETALYATDLAAAERFYTEVLGLRAFARQDGRHVFFRCGDGVFLVFNPDRTATETSVVGDTPVPRHGAAGPGHTAFRVREDELDWWRRRLDAYGVAIEAEVAWPAGGRSVYVRDPAGNSIELASPRLWGLAEPE
jgi:catechol 2,3-dioxygenase-like lactoylglutathione lyase family enzyme